MIIEKPDPVRLLWQTYSPCLTSNLPIGHEQDYSGYSLIYLARHFPQLFRRATLDEMDQAAENAHNANDYSVERWWRAIHLDATRTLLGMDWSSIHTIVANADHHTSGLRNGVLICLYFLTDLIHDELKEELKNRIRHNLEVHYLGSDAGVYLLSKICSKEELRDFAKECLAEFKFHNRDERDILTWLSKEVVSPPNPFNYYLTEIQSCVIEATLRPIVRIGMQGDLFE